jgi:hypothetical protein
MVSVPVSSAVDRGFVAQSDQVKDNKNNKKQRLVGSESGECVRLEWHVYPRTIVSVSWQNKDLTKRVDLI